MTDLVQLLPNQVAWAARIEEILDRCAVYIDISRTGAGKTPITIYTAQQLGLPIFVITTLTACSTWQAAAERYAIPVIAILSYEKLAGVINHELKHPFLTRNDYNEKGERDVTFTATPEYEELVQKGLLLVIDEADAVKNATARNSACCAMTKPITSTDSDSRVALLSATAMVTSGEHVFNIFRILGVTEQKKLIRVERTGVIKMLGLHDIIYTCTQIDAQATDHVMKTTPVTRGNAENLCKTLFTQIVCPYIAGAADESLTMRKEGVICRYINYYCRVTHSQELEDAAEELSLVLRFDPLTQRIARNYNMGALQRILQKIERAKVPEFARLARKQLRSDERCKIVLSMNFLQSIRHLEKLLADYAPLVMTGASTERREIIASFNDDPIRRVFIFTTKTGGASISLHDTVGDSPRHMLISPSYSLVDMVQAAGRVFREGSKSSATVRIIYGKMRANREMLMIRALNTKSEVLGEIFASTSGVHVVLPKDYEEVVEP